MKIAENVYMLNASPNGHVFFIKDEENILIDTGMPGMAKSIIRELEALGADIKSIDKILLTHHDVDHIGSAKTLQDESGAELWAPALDVPYIYGDKKRQGVKRAVSALINAPKPQITGTYDDCQNFGGIQAIAAPGHTPGHTIFLYNGIVFAGDLLRHLNGRFSVLPSFMNWYLKATRESIGLLKTLEFEWLCPSHGQPVRHNAALNAFLTQF